MRAHMEDSRHTGLISKNIASLRILIRLPHRTLHTLLLRLHLLHMITMRHSRIRIPRATRHMLRLSHSMDILRLHRTSRMKHRTLPMRLEGIRSLVRQRLLLPHSYRHRLAEAPRKQALIELAR